MTVEYRNEKVRALRQLLDAEIQRLVLADADRPCLFHVAGPCHHPKCLEAHYDTIRQRASPKTPVAPEGV